MDAARWERIQAIFNEAIALDGDERTACLARACGGDSDLREVIGHMLDADARPGSVLDRGFEVVAARTLGPALSLRRDQQIGPYRLEELIGEGGMGVVWRARRLDVDSVVAIKFLPHAGLSPARFERFTREMRLLARLRHPYIATFLDAGMLDDRTPWFVMELVDGVSLTEYCRTRVPRILDRIALFANVCDAVHHAHRHLVVHRDLKPSNILVTRSDGTPRLLDFGIARELPGADGDTDHTAPGPRFFSKDYAAPEWIRDGDASVSADVYSLGVILYELLTGQLPFRRARIDASFAGPPARPSSIAGAAGDGGPDASQISWNTWRDLDALCLKAVHEDPARRYASIEALQRDVEHLLRHEPLEARPDGLGYRVGKFVRRHRMAVAAAAAAVILIAGISTAFTVRLASARDRATREASLATAMNRFLSDDLLGQSDPFRSGDAKEALADAVTRSGPRIDVQFAGNPTAAAQLHYAIARALDGRSEYDAARREYDSAARLFIQGDGPLSPGALLVALQLASMEARSYQPGTLDRAKALIDDAEAKLSKLPAASTELVVWRASARGVIAMTANDAKAANQYFAEAVTKARQDTGFDEHERTRVEEYYAFSLIRAGDAATAEPLLRDIVGFYTRRDGAESPTTLRARIRLAQALFIEQKYAAAVDEGNAVFPALERRLGGDHEVVLTLLGMRAAAAGSLGRWDDAIRDDLAVHHAAAAKTGPPTFFSIGALSDAALSQCRAGRFVDGEANARQAFDAAVKGFERSSGLASGCAYALATCLVGLNQLDAATEYLDGIDVKAVAQMTGDANISAGVALTRADIAVRRGDHQKARDYLAATTVFDRPGAPAGEAELLRSVRARLSQPH